MSQASIAEQAPGVLALTGVLDYRTAPALRERGGRLIASVQAEACVIDCANVEKSSSVGLSLLLAFLRDAAAAGKTLSVRSVPQDMQEIARVCELQDILPLED
ncbi:STAS domain-containing protein [Pseudomonas zhanjiangensis]|uniref:Lipid asymmetry maintenance protein MlaB n=1 Tax=Pseudomonas zhanjiangensis TaxID=3239015 RepID=A0ABV3YSV1_9PSED